MIPADLAAERQHLAFADARGAERREIIAPPLVRHADPQAAHADDVHDDARSLSWIFTAGKISAPSA